MECNDLECIDATSIRNFAHDHSEGSQFGDAEEPDWDEIQEFVVSNRDFDTVHVYVDGDFMAEVNKKRGKLFRVEIGLILEVFDLEDNLLLERTVQPDQGLLVVHQQLLNEAKAL